MCGKNNSIQPNNILLNGSHSGVDNGGTELGSDSTLSNTLGINIFNYEQSE